MPVVIEKGGRDLVERQEKHEIQLEYKEPPWAVSSRIHKRRLEAMADAERAESDYYRALGGRQKAWERLTGSALRNEILAEEKEAELRAMEAVEAVDKKGKFIKERIELEELELKVKKAELEKRLREAQGTSGNAGEEPEDKFKSLKDKLKDKRKIQDIWDDHHIKKDIQDLKKQFKGKKILEAVLTEVWDEYIQGKPQEEWTEDNHDYFETLKAVYEKHNPGSS